jgi:hypothetical protein
MPSRIQIHLKVITFGALTGIGAVPCVAQVPAEGFRNVLRKHSTLTTDGFAALERVEILVKLLPVARKREGVVLLIRRSRRDSRDTTRGD